MKRPKGGKYKKEQCPYMIKGTACHVKQGGKFRQKRGIQKEWVGGGGYVKELV